MSAFELSLNLADMLLWPRCLLLSFLSSSDFRRAGSLGGREEVYELLLGMELGAKPRTGAPSPLGRPLSFGSATAGRTGAEERRTPGDGAVEAGEPDEWASSWGAEDDGWGAEGKKLEGGKKEQAGGGGRGRGAGQAAIGGIAAGIPSTAGGQLQPVKGVGGDDTTGA